MAQDREKKPQIDLRGFKEVLKASKRGNSTNRTFRFQDDVFVPFQKKCDAEGFKVTKVLEEFMRVYIRS